MNAVIVEDHALFSDLVRLICDRDLQLNVMAVAENGRTAIDHICSLRPELVILDIYLPDMNGFAVAQAVKSQGYCPRFLAVSVGRDPYVLQQVGQCGFSGYVDKCSASMETLKEAITTVSEGRSYLGHMRDLMKHSADHSTQPSFNLDRLLTPREMQILRLIGYALSDAEIAALVHLSPSTVQSCRSHLMKKLNVSGTPKLANFAVTHGITDLQCAIGSDSNPAGSISRSE